MTSLASRAETAAEHWVRSVHGCTHTVRAMRARYQRQDLFACDVVGKSTGRTVYCQVTTGDSSAVAHRRRKLEVIPWVRTDLVFVLEMRVDRSSRPFKHAFRVHQYLMRGTEWHVRPDLTDIPAEWFKPFVVE